VSHELLPAMPTPESCDVMWFHIVSGYTSYKEKKGASTRFHVGEKERRKVSFLFDLPAMTLTPAA
jgi:hypothetical protein